MISDISDFISCKEADLEELSEETELKINRNLKDSILKKIIAFKMHHNCFKN